MNIESMIAAVDFTDPANAAATWASTHFAPNASVALLHVVEPPNEPRFTRNLVPSAEAIAADMKEAADRRVVAFARAMHREQVRTFVRVGKPHEVITSLVQEIGADVIVVGPHGVRRPSRFLGTTAERIVRTSSVPVLVAAHTPPGPPRNILVSVEDAPITSELLRWTNLLAEMFDANIKLLHVWSNAVYSHVASMSLATEPSEADARAEITREMRDAAQHWLDELAAAGVRRDRITAALSYGHPADVILEIASAMPADLIVLGRSGSGRVTPPFLGSTVGTVLRGAPCSVLVVVEPPDSASETW